MGWSLELTMDVEKGRRQGARMEQVGQVRTDAGDWDQPGVLGHGGKVVRWEEAGVPEGRPV